MAEILFAPDRERVVTSNVWAFLHWLRTMHRIDLEDWAALQRFSVAQAGAFCRVIAEFAGDPGGGRLPLPALPRFAGEVVPDNTLPPEAGESREGEPPTARIRQFADLLLHADLRPDDTLLVAGPARPWDAAPVAAVTYCAAAPAALLAATADSGASVLVAPAQALAEAAFQRPHRRPNLGRLRTIIATGGPLSPEGRRRIYTWVKADVLLLARTGDTFWGNPLEPVLARPPATPAFLTPRPAVPVPR